ncbi:polyprenyl synthetase family protein [Chloroflexota bacterium]
MSLSGIYQPIREDLAIVEERIRLIADVDSPKLAQLLEYTLHNSGKRLRPALVLLSGKFYNYNPTYLLPMAVAIEILHTATLLHDDVIDSSATRRGRATVNQVWGGDKAIMVGDYMLAKAEELVADTHNLSVVKLFGQTLMTISGGEVDQSDNAFNLEQTREQYFQTISKKTAALISLATESGAILSGAPEGVVRELQQYGYNLGVAFQIVDDILDFIATEEELGKPVGSDLAQGTLTLPSIMVIERYPEDNPVRKVFQNENRQENIKLALELVSNSDIIENCYKVAHDYCSQAYRNLEQFPENASRQALYELVEYVIRRRK